MSIFQFGGPIHFANTEYFRTQLEVVTGLNSATLASAKKLLQESQAPKPDGAAQPDKVRKIATYLSESVD